MSVQEFLPFVCLGVFNTKWIQILGSCERCSLSLAAIGILERGLSWSTFLINNKHRHLLRRNVVFAISSSNYAFIYRRYFSFNGKISLKKKFLVLKISLVAIFVTIFSLTIETACFTVQVHEMFLYFAWYITARSHRTPCAIL